MTNVKVRTQKSLPMPVLGKWHFECILKPAYYRMNASRFSFGFFKMIEMPQEGYMVNRNHYKGFWIRFDFEYPSFGFAWNFNTDIVVQMVSRARNRFFTLTKRKDGSQTYEETKEPPQL